MSLGTIRYDLISQWRAIHGPDIVPKEPPHPPVKVFKGDASQIILPAYLAWDLQTSTILLTEAALEKRGGYEEGLEAPEASVAYSTGAILSAFATIEAYINETITIHAGHNRRGGPLTLFREDFMEQSILTRIESLFLVLDIEVDWSRGPYQSLKLLSIVRNALVHHEGGVDVIVANGFFPKKALKEVVRKIKSPYIDDPYSPYHWHTHILTPNGAVWATNIMIEVIHLIDSELDRVE